ncbi:MAG: oligosaccharide flippase family protein [Algoriphagus sp.]|uniref:oligosaccharide flippase family protein n=1 Tax=Algoriphagus sp. TaxID=1872435 RepID=UPI0017A149C7|nr:oligosaccharide flippase family protein [Algoriphagus sp.]NVJ86762.1 oligosaccharide flippase family protein [Algoriphagus sp.]
MGSKVVSAAKSVLIGSFISKGISFISTIILARLLFPEDYGSLLLATIITGLIGQIGSMGFELYYLQFKGEKSEREKLLKQVYFLRVIMNFILFLIQFIAGIVLIVLFSEKISGGIIVLLSFSLMIEGFNSPQETILRDQINFKKITIGNIYREIFGTLAKIASAFWGLGGLSFGIGPVVGSVIRLFYFRYVVKYQPGKIFIDRKIAVNIFNYGKYMLFASAGNFLVQQVDKFVLASFFSKEIVGRYTFSWNFASMPFNYLIVPQAQLNMSYITRFKAGDYVLFDKLSIIQKMIFFIFFPVTLFLLFFVEEAVVFLFSDKWIETVPIVSILLVYYAFQSITFPFSGVLNGLGRPDINSRILVSRAIVLVISLLLVSFLYSDIITYTYVFVGVSLVFDIIKIIKTFNLIGVLNNSVFFKFQLDILFFLLICLMYFLNIENEIYRLFLFVFLIMVFFISSYLFDKEKSILAYNLFKDSLLSKI